MNEIIKTTLLGLFFGTFGTTIGGIIGTKLKNPSKKFLSFILSFASGLMLAIVCFELIPEAMSIATMPIAILGIIIGIIVMVYCDILVDKKINKILLHEKDNTNNNNITKHRLLKTGIIVGIGLAIHNIPEGLAIGSGFEASIKLGFALAIAICFHDLPEGLSMAVPMKNGGMKSSKVILYVLLSGVATGIGAFFGAILGGISQEVIAICLAFAAGAMIYIVSGELIPESNRIYNGKLNAIGNIIGLIIGIVAMNINI